MSTRRTRHSLRVELPLLLLVYSAALGTLLYFAADREQERRFERDFLRQQTIRATELQSETERAAERGEIHTALREFTDLALFEEIEAAMFVSPDNEVVLSSRRDWAGRPLDVRVLGLAPDDRALVEAAMGDARTTEHTRTVFSADRNALIIVMPAALQVQPGDVRVDRRALILLQHDLSYAKAVNRSRLREQFALAGAGLLLLPLGLGVILHLFVTRRIERVHDAMERFAAGQPVDEARPPDSGNEIGRVHRHFLAIAAAARQEITERRKAEAELLAANERFTRHESSLAALTRSYVSDPEAFHPIVETITESVTRTLDANRVGVWRRAQSGAEFRCEDVFTLPAARHSVGASLTEARCGEFFGALARDGIIATASVSGDARTACLTDSDMRAPDLPALLAVPIRSRGVTVGVLSCARPGSIRAWTLDEQTFSLAVANLLAALIAQLEGRQLEQQLRQSQKLEAIGQLAGGVAHDFNNLLTVILGRAEEAKLDSGVSPAMQEALDDISDGALRAAALTRQLLTFSRRQPIQVRDVDVNTVVSDLARMLGRILGEDIALDITPSSQPAQVRADPGMIEQVIVNLAVNARDAMPSGGRLSIATTIRDRVDDPRGAQADRWVCLDVTDTGSGIAEADLPRIFEPFFTTKEIGKGTGLGLATVHGILQQHGGWMEVDSALGQGTRFRALFPFRPPAGDAVVAAPAVSASAGGHETILLVEDEDSVRALIGRVLASRGYTLLQARSGPEAIDIWRDARSTIDLVITDLIMPGGLNGAELIERLRADQPALGVVYMSGYSAKISVNELSIQEGAAYLTKPFAARELARVVRETLDARAQR
jgi:signal transduction histidine kinase/ActR/RegA family two-component response regulator